MGEEQMRRNEKVVKEGGGSEQERDRRRKLPNYADEGNEYDNGDKNEDDRDREDE